jgi:DNA-binding NtrC family response regulator
MHNPVKVLIVEDEPHALMGLAELISGWGYRTETARDGVEGWDKALAWDPAIVVTDLKMPRMDGIGLLTKLAEQGAGLNANLAVIVLTAMGNIELAVDAMKLGAYDFLQKPVDATRLRTILANATRQRETEIELEVARRRLRETGVLGGLVGGSKPMREIFGLIEQIASSNVSVLITGESGTGKELVARAIHHASPRRFHPLVAIHCGALTETLLESELFGHEKGAFTGAQYRKKGKFEIAEGGTVFLDEIGDISLKTQTDLLRVLQEREITRVGGNQNIKVDFRCVAATNKDLEKLIEEGKFRPDLFYRLNVFRIELPPLRERREDIPLLVDNFVRKFSLAMNKRITRVSPAAMNQLQQQAWVGNVRELENAVERAMVVGREPELHEQDFIFKSPAVSNGVGKKLEDMERAHILRVVEECGGNQSHAAEILDIDRVTLYHKLKKYGWSRTPVEARSN